MVSRATSRISVFSVKSDYTRNGQRAGGEENGFTQIPMLQWRQPTLERARVHKR